jgi:non-lysosomal glucosylceramidase
MNTPLFLKGGCPCQQASGSSLHRREFLRLMGLGALTVASGSRAWAQSTPTGDLVPADKNLDPAWVRSLFERGSPSVYTGKDLNYIGMPIGGICTGQLYLGGDGKLWYWDLFNIPFNSGCSGARYQDPPKPADNMPVEQGFSIAVTAAGVQKNYFLDKSGFPDVTFRGEYPIGHVDYTGPDIPVAVSLEAFSPFIPLHADDSGIPGTYLHFTVKNISAQPLEATLTGWLQNAVCLQMDSAAALRQNKIIQEKGLTFLNCSLEVPTSDTPPRPDRVLEDWHNPTYQGWTTEGTAFGTGPILRSALPSYIGDVGGETARVVNSHATAPGADIAAKDSQTGKLIGQSFNLDRDYLNFWIGGGYHPDRTCLNLIVDGKVVQTATGNANHPLILRSFDLRPWRNKSAHLEIVDLETGAWGNIGVGKITLSDKAAKETIVDRPDYGTMGLALFGAPAETALESVDKTTLTAASPAANQTLIGALGRKLSLPPGQSAEVVFALTWNFPHLQDAALPDKGRYYATKYDSALATARRLGMDWDELSSATRLWRDTWYDSTLPYWFLDRTFLTIATLATSTPYRFPNGRFYSWEGVGSCAGTCTHVWHYAHAVARLFPELERDTRERVDLGISLDPVSGVSGFRGEFDRNLAVDGQAGTLLRCYREHQMAPDNSFLQKNWVKIKKMFEPLFHLDADEDGILEGPQMNTLDTAWFGKNSWQSGLYLAALRAGAAMASEMGDQEFGSRCSRIADRGFENIPKELFNGEYFSDKIDPAHLDAINSGSGCEIDQVFGQSWAFQVGLPRVLPEKETRSALQALWKYNFAPDVGPYRAAHPPGRWYAQAGEAGLLMCTFPRPDWDYAQARGNGNADFAAGYFNECMTGFEYQVAGHMIAEGMVQEGFAITRAIHDRYHASKRNPWNEIECGDHYSRAMAGFGVFLAACGYESHGPKGHLGFNPKISPENFRAPFTASEGWGTFSQKVESGRQTAAIELRHGQLNLNTFALALAPGGTATTVQAFLDGQAVSSMHALDQGRLVLTFGSDFRLNKDQKLTVEIS